MDSVTESSENRGGAKRTIFGTIVHLLGLFFGILGVGVVYLLSDAAFTKANARNALNWQIFVLLVGAVLGVIAFGLKPVSDLFVILAALGTLLLVLLNTVFCLVAAVKALRGQEWRYPFTPNII
ncbi:DUF4870 domain-containing protein [Halorussus sp. MSC15.2]|uniref:DUF4870 domain-containing protein n=1 Tax=Halorussus sp. MSC15.2 TaxID=2283638 RepID=UPI0013D185E8|nr:DUF4870 domain-containing protein [Halorussus sp. MSC15.2]NEU57312.1 DUF4870 domain-containing protein [Halorussus sp. MSC15.2]